ncbi:MAG: site-specific DNA-methyltransferase, partial [Phycisphaerales bacterium]|nr:site-specific DNA-methyltransferase [Phycisphaerales bacterium]
QAAGRKLGLPLLNLVVWKKTNAGMGSFYRSQHELILLFKADNHAHRNNIQLGRHGRNRSNVWEYAGVNTFREGRDDDLRMHPTVKPVRMIADAIVDCTLRGEIVLDSFGGSGSTILAAERVDRRARVMELDPAFVDVAVRRWERETGIPAVNTATGLTFAQTAARRLRRRPRRAA